MEKYVLVPHSKYEAMTKSEHKPAFSTPQPSDVKANVNAPPPGLPADDVHAEQGLNVTEKEAEQIHKKLIELGYDQLDEGEVGEEKQVGNKQTINANKNTAAWSSFWQDI